MVKVWLYSVASFFSLGALLAAQHYSGGTHLQFMGESLGLVIVLLSCQVCFHLNGVDELLMDSKTQIFLQRTLKAAGAGLLLAGLLFYIFPKLSPGYAAAAASACFLIFGLVALRPVVRSVARHGDTASTLIVGSEMAAQRVYTRLSNDNPDNFRIVDYPDLPRVSRMGGISRIVVADPAVLEDNDAAQALLDLKFRGIQIETAADSFERAHRKIWVEGLSAEHLIFAAGFGVSPVYAGLKRALDLMLSTALLLITAPVMAVVAIAIKLESAGPVIFSQERVGLGGRRFMVHKFRSMRQDAEAGTGPTWAKKNDDRVTRIGGFLRKCRLDELPQMWNVLRGEMSFIGPRPERPYFVDLLKTQIPFFDLRHYVKPGITGWAQVMYPYGASVEDAYHKLEYDLYYAKHFSFKLDGLILLKTIAVVVKGQGQ